MFQLHHCAFELSELFMLSLDAIEALTTARFWFILLIIHALYVFVSPTLACPKNKPWGHIKDPREFCGIVQGWLERCWRPISQFWLRMLTFCCSAFRIRRRRRRESPRKTRYYYRYSTRSRPHQICCKQPPPKRNRSYNSLIVKLLAFTASAGPLLTPQTDHRYDSDSFLLRVDNCATSSFTNNLNDVVGPLTSVPLRIEGFGGKVSGVSKCTIRWTLEDDLGKVHVILLPNSYYCPQAPCRLLSPQHWSQTSNDKRGTWCATYGDAVVLHWDQGRFTRTIPLDPSTNVATVRSAPGFSRFKAFCAECVAFDATAVVSDDEEVQYNLEVSPSQVGVGSDAAPDTADATPPTTELPIDPLITAFDNVHAPDAPHVIEDEEDLIQDPQAQLLRWHHRLGHLSFRKLKMMATSGDLPKQLATCRTPVCSGCLFGKATKRPWRTRAPPNSLRTPTITCPGACVSVDQLESTTPGLIAQMKGIATIHRYCVATTSESEISQILLK